MVVVPDARSLRDQPRPDAATSGVSCSSAPPPGAALAAPLPTYSGGACPVLAPGRNVIVSKGAERAFLLLVPPALQPGESPPLIFFWHWLGGSAANMVTMGQVEVGVSEQRFVAVVPEAKSSTGPFAKVSLPWPITVTFSASRVEEELAFFDDMLACVAQQYNVNRQCVSSLGVSAGALFTAQLVGARSQLLASFVSISGGVGQSGGIGELIRPWVSPSRVPPALVIWGGPSDKCIGLNFDAASQALEQRLAAEGGFFVECLHNCKHTIPPFDPLPGMSAFTPLWGFVTQHPFWLGKGSSPFQTSGLPAYMPAWCGIGLAGAAPRTAPCDPPLCAF